MAMEIKDVEKLARLARIELTEIEKENFTKELESILKYVDQIREVDTKEAELSFGLIYNSYRQDENPRESNECAEPIRAQFPERDGDYLKVKKIL